MLDSQLTIADHIAALSRSCFFYIRHLRAIRQSLTPDAMKTLLYTFVSSRIDYCNSILTGVSRQLLQRLQSVQNAAARLLTGARRCEHVTPILRQLHWLPVRQRIIFKMALLVYKCRHGMAPPYMSTYCQPTRRLMSPALCPVRPTHCSTYEEKLRRPQFCRSRASRVEQFAS